jgi:hypothetical protein
MGQYSGEQSLVLIDVAQVQLSEHDPQRYLQLAVKNRYCLSIRGSPGLRS